MYFNFALLTTIGVASAFTPSSQTFVRPSSTYLEAELSRKNFIEVAASATIGIASGSANPYLASAEEKLDFSLPSYDSAIKNTGGFGDGTEAIINKSSDLTDPGAGEGEKEKEAMRKAEEARQKKLEAKRAERKAMEEETRRRDIEKKAENAKRVKELKGIFS